MLHQLAARVRRHQLHAAADAQRRQVGVDRGPQQRHLAGVPGRPDAGGARVRLGAVQGRVEVAAAGQDQPVQRGDHLGDALGERRDDQGAAAGGVHRGDVHLRQHGRLAVPRAPSGPARRTRRSRSSGGIPSRAQVGRGTAGRTAALPTRRRTAPRAVIPPSTSPGGAGEAERSGFDASPRGWRSLSCWSRVESAPRTRSLTPATRDRRSRSCCGCPRRGTSTRTTECFQLTSAHGRRDQSHHRARPRCGVLGRGPERGGPPARRSTLHLARRRPWDPGDLLVADPVSASIRHAGRCHRHRPGGAWLRLESAPRRGPGSSSRLRLTGRPGRPVQPEPLVDPAPAADRLRLGAVLGVAELARHADRGRVVGGRARDRPVARPGRRRPGAARPPASRCRCRGRGAAGPARSRCAPPG